MERPEGPTEVIEQSSKGHHGAIEIDTAGLSPTVSVLALRQGTPRLPADHISGASAQYGRRSPDAPAPACEFSLRQSLPSRRSDRLAIQNLPDKAREDASIARRPTGTTDRQERQLRNGMLIRTALQGCFIYHSPELVDTRRYRRGCYLTTHGN